MITVPKGWTLTTVGNAGRLQLGRQRAPRYHSGPNMKPYLRVANVFEDRIDLSDVKEMHFDADEFERYRLHAGDVLLNEGQSPDLLGRPAIYTGHPDEIAFTNSIIRFQAGDGVDPRWALTVFRHHMHSGRFARESRITTNIAHLSLGRLRSVEFPVPPLDEQRRIVDLLEDHLSRLDAAGAYLEAAQRRGIVLYDQLLGHELAAVESAEIPLAELLAEGLANGRSVPTEEGGFPVLRLTALRDGRIDLAERKPGAWTAADAKRFLVERDDFLIARGNGSLRLVGRGGLVIDDPDAVAFPDTLIRARPDRTRIHPEFLANVWNAPGVRRQIERAAKTTAGIFKVNQKDLAAVQVPVPSLADQERVATSVRGSRDAFSQLALEVDRSVARSSALRRSLLGAAFSGRLTGDPVDLSAAEEMIGA